MLQSFVSTSAICIVAISSSFLLQNPSFPSNLLTFLIPHMPTLAGHQSIPWLTFLFWQYKLTDAVPSWHCIFHFISTQKPSSTSAHLPFLWTPLISSNQTEISSVGWSMMLITTRLWSLYRPFTKELDAMILVGPFQLSILWFCDHFSTTIVPTI